MNFITVAVVTMCAGLVHAECGRETHTGNVLFTGGSSTNRGESPWYVAIYRKPTTKKPSYDLICGGSIVSTTVVLSVAHCFWGPSGAKNASLFAVATGKLYRDWDNPKDQDVQKSNIKSIHFPDHYFGDATNQQDNIAVLILESPFKFENYVGPVCLDFSATFNGQQLQEGNLGKVAGFGLTGQNSSSGSPTLKVVSLPYVSLQNCIKHTPESHISYLTRDKICAGYSNGTVGLCKGDSGGGLVFPAPASGVTRYYLRGIVSTAPSTSHGCSSSVIFFTSIIEHEQFIKQYL